MTKPSASLSLDLDNKWSYMKTRGDSRWKELPSYLDVVVPRVLGFLKKRGLTVTVFVVGQDAALPQHRDLLAAIAEAGHEIGNHSFHHEPWLHLYSDHQIEDELARAHDAIVEATGRTPVGFRGPGFTVSEATLRTLARLGYRYDGSTLPTFLGPLARFYYFLRASLTAEERRERKGLFGSFRDGLRPIKPYRWDIEDAPLVEIPVTTLPGLKVPVHVSYLLYLSVLSPALARLYFRTAVELCRATGTEMSLLLHPLDFLGRSDDHDGALSFFPAMGMETGRKLEVVDGALSLLADRFDVITMGEHARRVEADGDLPRRAPLFVTPRRH